jgi:hypothetical protein
MATCIAEAAGESAVDAQSTVLRVVLDRRMDVWRQSMGNTSSLSGDEYKSEFPFMPVQSVAMRLLLRRRAAPPMLAPAYISGNPFYGL